MDPRALTRACPLFFTVPRQVERLQPFVRDRRASYRQSLAVLAEAKRHRADLIASRRDDEKGSGIPMFPLYTKTSLMLGLGETQDEVGLAR